MGMRRREENQRTADSQFTPKKHNEDIVHISKHNPLFSFNLYWLKYIFCALRAISIYNNG